MSETFAPIFLYHPIEAPAGKKFTSQADLDGLSEAWVDTPTKFPGRSAPAMQEHTREAPKTVTVRKGRKESA